MKYLLPVLLIALIVITGCSKNKQEAVVYPQTNIIKGDYLHYDYDTTVGPAVWFDTLPNATGTLVQYSKDSLKLTVEGWTGSRAVHLNWEGKIDGSGYYYKEVNNFDSGAVRHHHYDIRLKGDTMVYHYHARTGDGTRHNVGGEITYETMTHFQGAISKK